MCTYYLKPSYFNGTVILAIFPRQGFSVFLFSNFTEKCLNFAFTYNEHW